MTPPNVSEFGTRKIYNRLKQAQDNGNLDLKKVVVNQDNNLTHLLKAVFLLKTDEDGVITTEEMKNLAKDPDKVQGIFELANTVATNNNLGNASDIYPGQTLDFTQVSFAALVPEKESDRLDANYYNELKRGPLNKNDLIRLTANSKGIFKTEKETVEALDIRIKQSDQYEEYEQLAQQVLDRVDQEPDGIISPTEWESASLGEEGFKSVTNEFARTLIDSSPELLLEMYEDLEATHVDNVERGTYGDDAKSLVPESDLMIIPRDEWSDIKQRWNEITTQEGSSAMLKEVATHYYDEAMKDFNLFNTEGGEDVTEAEFMNKMKSLGVAENKAKTLFSMYGFIDSDLTDANDPKAQIMTKAEFLMYFIQKDTFYPNMKKGIENSTVNWMTGEYEKIVAHYDKAHTDVEIRERKINSDYEPPLPGWDGVITKAEIEAYETGPEASEHFYTFAMGNAQEWYQAFQLEDIVKEKEGK